MAENAAMAIGAHPDDIEFYMAGTLLLLKKAGYETHYLNVASGNCGSTEHNAAATRSVRNTEARVAANILGAHFHGSLTDDLEIFYNLKLLRAVAAVIREVKPKIVLTHSPQDYMEDHTNTSRLAVTAAFTRGMSNFKTLPARPAANSEVTVYHAMPHGLCDELRRRIVPGAFVNTSPVHKTKHQALAAHKSQQAWLDAVHRWFDHELYNVHNGIDREPRVQVETAPGAVSGWHHHDRNESSLYVVRGVLRLK